MQTMTEEKKSSTFAVKNHSEIPVSMLLLLYCYGEEKNWNEKLHTTCSKNHDDDEI